MMCSPRPSGGPHIPILSQQPGPPTRAEIGQSRRAGTRLGEQQRPVLAVASTSWAEEKLYQLIVHRHDAMLPTVFTSRIALETIGESETRITTRYSEAIVSRLSDANVVAERYISAPDFRHRGAIPKPRTNRRKPRGR